MFHHSASRDLNFSYENAAVEGDDVNAAKTVCCE
jgi:hypothetical protein